MCSNVLQPNPPYISLSISLFLSHLNYVPRIALLQVPKKSHLHHWSFKRTIFFTELCGLFGFLCLGQSFSQRKQESENLLTPSPLLSFLGLSFPISFTHVLFHHPAPHPPTFFLSFCLSPLVFLCSCLLASPISLRSHEEDQTRCLHGPSLRGVSGSEDSVQAPESLAGL